MHAAILHAAQFQLPYRRGLAFAIGRRTLMRYARQLPSMPGTAPIRPSCSAWKTLESLRKWHLHRLMPESIIQMIPANEMHAA